MGLPMNIQYLRRVSAFAMLAFAFGCSDAADPVEATLLVEGTVRAPAQITFAQAAPSLLNRMKDFFFGGPAYADLSGVLPVPAGVSVRLIQVNDDGTVVRTIQTVQTDANGHFAFDPVTEAPDLMVVVADSAGNEMRALVGTGQTDIDPVSEFLTREVLEDIAASGGSRTLADYTNEERDAAERAAAELDIDLSATTIEDAVSEVGQENGPDLSDIVDELATGSSGNADRLTGTFALVGLEMLFEGNQVQATGLNFFGDVSFNGAGTLTLNDESTRLFEITATEITGDSDNGEGGAAGYEVEDDGETTFMIEEGGLRGQLNADDNILFFAEAVEDEHTAGLVSLVKRGSGLSASILNGPYHAISFEFIAESDNGSPRLEVIHSRSTATFDGSGQVVFSNQMKTHRSMPIGGTRTLTSTSSDHETDNHAYTVSSDGRLSLGMLQFGVVAADGGFAVASLENNMPTNPDFGKGVTFFIKQASTTNDMSVDGAYAAFGFSVELGANQGALIAGSQHGTFDFDVATKNLTLSLETTQFNRNLDNGATTTDSDPEAEIVSYLVGADGTLTLPGAFSLPGAITASGELVVLPWLDDAPGSSALGIFVAIRKP